MCQEEKEQYIIIGTVSTITNSKEKNKYMFKIKNSNKYKDILENEYNILLNKFKFIDKDKTIQLKSVVYKDDIEISFDEKYLNLILLAKKEKMLIEAIIDYIEKDIGSEGNTVKEKCYELNSITLV